MHRKVIVTVRRHMSRTPDGKIYERTEIQGPGKEMPAAAKEEYIRMHGHHFTPELADWASGLLVNADKSTHKWSAHQVTKTLGLLGLELPETTQGDALYLANWYYSDLYPDLFKDETLCLRAAYKQLSDPDGYDGQAFCRWLTDMKGRGVEIPWEEFI